MADNIFTDPEVRKHATEAKRRLSDVPRILKNDLSDLSATRGAMVGKRLEEMPVTFRKRYIVALSGKRPMKAIEAFCYECICWQRGHVQECTAQACPLWDYRPEQSKAGVL